MVINTATACLFIGGRVSDASPDISRHVPSCDALDLPARWKCLFIKRMEIYSYFFGFVVSVFIIAQSQFGHQGDVMSLRSIGVSLKPSDWPVQAPGCVVHRGPDVDTRCSLNICTVNARHKPSCLQISM